MPATTINSESQYKEIIAAKGLTAIQFTAPWSEACKALAPKFDEYATKYGSDSIKFYRVDINDQQEVAMDAHLTKLTGPTFHFYRDGEKVKEHVGDTYPALERALGAFLKQ